MQLAMWVILGGTVGLAALLDRHQHIQLRITLGPDVQCGDIRLQLPAHWMAEITGSGMITAKEFPPKRFLEVTVAPPAEQGLVDQLLQQENPGSPQAVQFGPKGDQTGRLFVWQQQSDDDGQPRAFGRVVATTSFPNGPEVTLRLEHLEPEGQSLEIDDDIELLRRLAATVQFVPAGLPFDEN
jgi:hypothetical protein